MPTAIGKRFVEKAGIFLHMFLFMYLHFRKIFGKLVVFPNRRQYMYLTCFICAVYKGGMYESKN